MATCESHGHMTLFESCWLSPCDFPFGKSLFDCFSARKTQSSSQTRGPRRHRDFQHKTCIDRFWTSNKRCRPSCKVPPPFLTWAMHAFTFSLKALPSKGDRFDMETRGLSAPPTTTTTTFPTIGSITSTASVLPRDLTRLLPIRCCTTSVGGQEADRHQLM